MDVQAIRDEVAQICKRPGMYVGDPNFVHLAIFIDGYVYGLRRAGAEDFPTTDRGFAPWLGRRLLGRSTNQVWWAVIRDAFPDEWEAISNLVPLLDEYLAAGGQSGDATA